MSVQTAQAESITESEGTTTEAPVTETKTEAVAPVETKPETKQPDVKTETAEKPAEVVKYDLKLPEGSLIDKSRVEEIVSIAKERGLSNVDAQKLLEVEHQSVTNFITRQTNKLSAESKQWLEELKRDPEIGGEHFNQNIEYAKRAVDGYFDPAFKKILDDTGYGNNPMLVKGFAKIGKAMQPDKIIKSNSAVGGTTEKTIEQRLYPKMFQDKGD